MPPELTSRVCSIRLTQRSNHINNLQRQLKLVAVSASLFQRYYTNISEKVSQWRTWNYKRHRIEREFDASASES